MLEEETIPFDVTEEVEVGDLTAVQEEILPKANGVKVQIVKASVKPSKDKLLKSLNVMVRFIEGIVSNGELKYESGKKTGFTSFMDLVIWASPEKSENSDWYKNGQHLLGFKQFLQAIGEPVSPAPKINDAWLESIKGRECLVNIVHEEESSVINGERVKTGAFSAKFKNWKKVPA